MRPKGLNAICIIGLVMAGLGGMSLVAGLGGLLLQPVIQSWATDFQQSVQRGMPAGQQQQQQFQAQMEMNEAIMAMQRQYLPLTLIGYGLLLITVCVLGIACIRGLTGKANGLKWLLIAMIVAIVCDIARTYPAMKLQQESRKITQDYMQRVMQTMPNPAAARTAAPMMRASMQMTTMITVLFIYGWLLMKCGFYGTGLWYVSRSSVREAYDASVREGPRIARSEPAPNENVESSSADPDE